MTEKLYKIYNGRLTWADVAKETECFYYLAESIPAFRYSSRIEKSEAIFTPHEAIQEAIDDKKTEIGLFQNRLVKFEAELKLFEKLRENYVDSSNFSG